MKQYIMVAIVIAILLLIASRFRHTVQFFCNGQQSAPAKKAGPYPQDDFHPPGNGLLFTHLFY